MRARVVTGQRVGAHSDVARQAHDGEEERLLVLLAQGCLSPSTAPDAYRSPSGLGGLSSAVSCLKDVPYDPIHERSTHEFKVRSPGQPSIDLPAPAVPSAEILDPFDPK